MFEEDSWLVDYALKLGYENRGTLGCLIGRGSSLAGI